MIVLFAMLMIGFVISTTVPSLVLSADVAVRRISEHHNVQLIAELDHRVKNALACVAAVAQRSRDFSGSADEFLEVLNARINSLAKTHALLSRSHWQGVHLDELVAGIKDGMEGSSLVAEFVSYFRTDITNNEGLLNGAGEALWDTVEVGILVRLDRADYATMFVSKLGPLVGTWLLENQHSTQGEGNP